jgi:hypothetical protein
MHEFQVTSFRAARIRQGDSAWMLNFAAAQCWAATPN